MKLIVLSLILILLIVAAGCSPASSEDVPPELRGALVGQAAAYDLKNLQVCRATAGCWEKFMQCYAPQCKQLSQQDAAWGSCVDSCLTAAKAAQMLSTENLPVQQQTASGDVCAAGSQCGFLTTKQVLTLIEQKLAGAGTSQKSTLPTVQDFGAVANDQIDDSAAFQQAIDETGEFYVPAGTYKVQNLKPKSGMNIIASSQAAIEGVTPDAILFVSDGFDGVLHSIKITGGSWRLAETFWQHTGSSALASSRFQDMAFSKLHAGFNLSASVGNYWSDCLFYQVDFGLVFPGVAAGGTNVNVVDQCQFMQWDGAAIYFGPGPQGKNGNAIKYSWFEEGKTGPAIYASGNMRVLHIHDNYFEEAGCCNPNFQGETVKGTADIILDAPIGSAQQIKLVTIEQNIFGPAWKNQPTHIQNNGLAEFTARDNSISLLQEQTFAHLNGSTMRIISFENNYLGADTKEGDYLSRLYTSLSGQQASWSSFSGSGNIVDAESKRFFVVGQQGQRVLTLQDSTSPSVQNGNVYLIPISFSSPEITNFLDGLPGQTIRIATQKEILLKANDNLQLRDNLDYQMKPGRTLTLTMYTPDIWTEDGRN